MRLVYFGSGAFGLPTLERLAAAHDVALIVSQPDRPAGRARHLMATPIAHYAQERGISIVKPEHVNDAAVVRHIRAIGAEAFVVIAFGQKLGQGLLEGVFSINLHGSLLPKYRGAAPINWAMINGEPETGVTAIALSDRMDAGALLGQASMPIDPGETAGELHDRLATLGPDLVVQVLDQFQQGELRSQSQDERLVTHAPKLTKADGTVSFNQPARKVRQRIHGLTPWPGCTIKLDGRPLRIARAQVIDQQVEHSTPGLILSDHSVACAPGAIRFLEVQSPGGKVMSFRDYSNGQSVMVGARCEAI